MRVYHFLPEKYAINDLENKHIKIARFEELNDPFEMLSLELPESKMRKAFVKLKNDISAYHGIICFSGKWSNPVIWSHYADKHKGICLGFDVSNKLLAPVEYIAKRRANNILDGDGKITINEKFMLSLLTIKYASWKYERESRIFVALDHNTKISGKYFMSFDDDIVLREVILGAEHKGRVGNIKTILKDYENVRLIQSRMAFRSFKIVENKKKTIKLKI